VLPFKRVARTLKYLPLTFIAGTWGFVVFVPYLLVFITAVGLTRRNRLRAQA
jgi:hypothetical protein